MTIEPAPERLKTLDFDSEDETEYRLMLAEGYLQRARHLQKVGKLVA